MMIQEKKRTIAVEEHFATPEYLDATEKLAVFAGEEPEQNVMSVFPKNPLMRQRVSDIATHLREMDDSGTDLAVLSLNPPVCRSTAMLSGPPNLPRK